MRERTKATVEGVNETTWNVWPSPTVPQAPDRKLIVKEPRPVGFRKP